MLYSAEQRGLDLATVLGEEATRAEREPARRASWEYARTIVEGVDEHRAAIDELLETFAQGWPLERMPAIDRALARIAVWEMSHGGIPAAVAISEAVDAARTYSTDDSGGYLNGLLARIARTL